MLVSSKPGASRTVFLEPSVTMILISVQKVAKRRLISGEDLFFFRDLIIILVQKVGCFLCMARQYFLCVKMALGSKRLDTPVLNKREPILKILNPNTGWDPNALHRR